jgi:hypothetical protein
MRSNSSGEKHTKRINKLVIDTGVLVSAFAFGGTPRDPKDDMVLECCLAAEANLLITGDKDLLSEETLPFHLKILTPKEYVKSSPTPG